MSRKTTFKCAGDSFEGRILVFSIDRQTLLTYLCIFRWFSFVAFVKFVSQIARWVVAVVGIFYSLLIGFDSRFVCWVWTLIYFHTKCKVLLIFSINYSNLNWFNCEKNDSMNTNWFSIYTRCVNIYNTVHANNKQIFNSNFIDFHSSLLYLFDWVIAYEYLSV